MTAEAARRICADVMTAEKLKRQNVEKTIRFPSRHNIPIKTRLCVNVEHNNTQQNNQSRHHYYDYCEKQINHC